MISLILFALAAICNAIMDNITHHWDKSIFSNSKKFNAQWWNTAISWENKYNNNVPSFLGIKLIWFSDAWHLFKSIMITLICCSIVLLNCDNVWNNPHWHNGVFQHVIIIAIYGSIWNCIFNLFYNHLLNKK